MNSYISNKRKIDRLSSILYIFFWIINSVFLYISFNMVIKIWFAKKSKWFDDAAKAEVSSDPFFLGRTDMLMTSMTIVMLLIIIFSLSTVVLIRNIQLKNMYTQMGVYTVIGYDSKAVFKICIKEPVADIIIAFPISLLCSYFSWKAMLTIDTIGSIVKLLDSNWIEDMIAYLLVCICICVVVVIHTWFFVKKSLKKGIRYMLGKGVV